MQETSLKITFQDIIITDYELLMFVRLSIDAIRLLIYVLRAFLRTGMTYRVVLLIGIDDRLNAFIATILQLAQKEILSRLE